MVADGEGLIDAIIVVAVTNNFYNNNPEVIQQLQKVQEEIAKFMKEREAEGKSNGHRCFFFRI